MQSNLSQTQTPVYDDYPEFETNNFEDIYSDDEVFYDYEDYTDAPEQEGKQRVLWLLLIVFGVIIIAGILIYGVFPYIETFAQTSPPPLPPAVQT